MRAKMFAIGLVMAAQSGAVSAQDAQRPLQVTLTNGCVYSQNALAQGNEWSLIYTQAGTTAQCPLTIYGLTTQAQIERTHAVADPVVTRTRTPAPYTTKRRSKFNPQYMVGVFR